VSIYDRAVDLNLKLEAARSADSNLELITKGTRLVDSLEEASKYFASAETFRLQARVIDRPNLDRKAVAQAVSGFRAGLSRHGSMAFQHQPATTMIEVAKSQRDRAARWATARWKALFAPYDPLLERVQTEHLVGKSINIAVAQARASKLRAARSLDPIANEAALRSSLGGEDVEAWLHAIETLATELSDALNALDAQRAAFTPEVREALRRAASDGLPLSEVSDELLGALRKSGVDGHLVVRADD